MEPNEGTSKVSGKTITNRCQGYTSDILKVIRETITLIDLIKQPPSEKTTELVHTGNVHLVIRTRKVCAKLVSKRLKKQTGEWNLRAGRHQPIG